MAEHSQLTHAETHEPKHIGISSTSDAGKVITQDSSTDGESIFRYLAATEITYDPAVSGLTATDVKAALDEIVALFDDAANVTYDNSTSGLTADDVQAALDEINEKFGDAANVDYDNTASGLTAADVKAALDELATAQARVFGSSTVTNNSTAISLTGAGDTTFQTAGDFTEITGIWDDPLVEPNNEVTLSASGDRLVAAIAGDYVIHFWATSEFDSPNEVIGYNFGINGTVSTTRPIAQRLATSGERYGASAHGYITLAANDEVSIHAAATVSGDLTLVNAQFSIELVRRA